MDKSRLIKSLRVLANADIMLALEAPGALYLEGHTDLEILRAWANVLNHPAAALLESVLETDGMGASAGFGRSARAKDHYDALCLVREGLPGLVLVDGDAAPGVGSTPITGSDLQRLRWNRYETENCLLHPAALKRLVIRQVGDPQPGGPGLAKRTADPSSNRSIASFARMSCFPQLMHTVAQYLDEEVIVHSPADLMDVFLAPHYGWVVERLGSHSAGRGRRRGARVAEI